MPAATNVTDLTAITEKEWGKLVKLLDSVPPELAGVKDADGWSITDLLNHRAHWIDLFFGWYEDGLAGKEVFFPAKGYKWNDLKKYNAEMLGRYAGRSFDEARAALEAGHKRLMDFYAASDDAALYSGPMQGANNKWTPGRWSEANGAAHYRSAAKYIRKRLREG
ncbi:MAG: hypothetical protein CR993_00500 [Rhodobacterales bacterium]|nr:MAG: hypothetical protein CR993_00500 [Rhodobacterales bacterium]